MAQNPPSKKYRNYDYERQNMMNDKVWYALGNPQFVPQFKPISEHYNVPVDCLQKWRQKLKKDINWIPDQGHAEEQRMFTPEKEAELANTFLKCADNGIQMSNTTARFIFTHVDQNTLEKQDLRFQKQFIGFRSLYSRISSTLNNIKTARTFQKKASSFPRGHCQLSSNCNRTNLKF